MGTILKDILNFLLPPRCMCCGKILADDNGLCPECFNQMTFISMPYCKHCGLPFADRSLLNRDMICPVCIREKKSPFRMERSALKYDLASKKAILAFKFMDKTENAKVFAKWLKIAGQDIFTAGVDVFIPVPLHYRRLIMRRYNQSALLAVALSRLTKIPADFSSLVKFRSTKPQAALLGQARRKNIRNAFKVKHPERIKGKRIVLIDDVLTTGSTVRECAKVLLNAGAVSVDVLTIARVYKD